MHSKASKYSSGYMTVGSAILNNIALSIITFDYSLDADDGIKAASVSQSTQR